MEPDDLIGQHIGQYEILEKIGRGGMAEVYKGLHPLLKRYVAIKLLGRDLQIDTALTQRFQREAQAIAALRHPNIVQVFDFGTYEGGHYMVMEYVEGTDLRDEIDRRRREGEPFTPNEILNLIDQIANALDYAHEQGIVHRDVKPGNILLNTKGQAILTDFGLVMLRDSLSQATLGHTFGTPEYIAPEQAMDSRAASPQSDIYSLGNVLYELITGQLPFEAESALSLALKHISEKPISPREYVPDLPPSVEAVILRALAKEPEQRQPTARALVEALRHAWEEGGLETTVVASTASTAEAETPPPPPPSEQPAFTPKPQPEPASIAVEPAPDLRAPAERKQRWTFIAIVLAFLVIGGLVITQALGGGGPLGLAMRQPTPTHTPSPTATAPPATTVPEVEATASPSPTAITSPTPSPTPTAMPTEYPTATPTHMPTPTPTLAAGEPLSRTADGMVMHFIPGGSFLMGADEGDPDATEDERPQHEVVLGPFWMDKTEVTTDQYKLCVADGACEAPYTRTAYDNPARGNHPMSYISWEQARNYCRWLNTETGWDIHLPTEAQWEKAASWDPVTESKRRYPWGDTLDRTRLQLGSTTAPANAFPEGSSPYGILNMAGNVREWVADWYSKTYYETEDLPPDPTGAEEGSIRVFRGGSYGSLGSADVQLRTTDRAFGYPESTAPDKPAKSADLGFRCAVDGERLPPEAD